MLKRTSFRKERHVERSRDISRAAVVSYLRERDASAALNTTFSSTRRSFRHDVLNVFK